MEVASCSEMLAPFLTSRHHGSEGSNTRIGGKLSGHLNRCRFCAGFLMRRSHGRCYQEELWTADIRERIFGWCLPVLILVSRTPLPGHWRLYLGINFNFNLPSGAYMNVTLYSSGLWWYSRRYDRISCRQKQKVKHSGNYMHHLR
jgi:hypothetical protein